MAEPGDLLHVHALTLMGQAISCLSWRGARAHAGVHQGRKSMRRVRACLMLAFADSKGSWRALDRAIALVCRGLSALRDAHARIEAIDRLLAIATEGTQRADLRTLRRSAQAQRVKKMARAQHDDPRFGQRRRELRLLVRTLDALPWDRVDEPSLRHSMALVFDRCEKARQRALHDGDREDWHRWRRRRRQLAQQSTVLAVCGIALDDLPSAQRKLASQLGESQDLSMLIEYTKTLEDLPKPRRRRLIDFLRSARGNINHDIQQRSAHTQKDRKIQKAESSHTIHP